MNPKFETLKSGLGNGLIVGKDYNYNGWRTSIDYCEFAVAAESTWEPMIPHLFSLKDLTKERLKSMFDELNLNDVFKFENIWLIISHGQLHLLPQCLFDRLAKEKFNVFNLPESEYINAAESKVYEPKSK